MTIVRHEKTERDYILLGTSYGMHRPKDQIHFKIFENLPYVPSEYYYVTVTDNKGNIKWLLSEDVRVISIDGVKIEDIKYWLYNENNTQN